ncbi:sensor histidine kinase [Spongiactinospora sp. 9N601]|uniref:sensor histidine kinase n=1 Tax=Spongiactinospora sp. 9N601 TaxID=3375149 RepID=UPI00378BB0AB
MRLLGHPVVRVVWRALLVAYLVVGAVLAVVEVWPRDGWPAGAGIAVVGVVAAAGCALPLLGRGPAALLVVALAGGLVLHGVAMYSGLPMIFVSVCMAPCRLPLRWGLAFVSAATGATAGVSAAMGVTLWAIFGISLGLGYCVIVAFLVRQLALMRELAESRAREAGQAERAHLAREIHDILAHAQSAQIVHLEGARLLLSRGEDVRAALGRVDVALKLAREGLEETKRAVDTLRGEDLRLAERLERLAVEHRSAGGAGCAVRVSGDLEGLSAGARLAVARTAQEALTNVRKHAPGAAAEVSLRRVADWCELEVRDHGGRARGDRRPGGGHGLVGMRERAELLGGSLVTGPGEGGFRVLLRVPAAERAGAVR